MPPEDTPEILETLEEPKSFKKNPQTQKKYNMLMVILGSMVIALGIAAIMLLMGLQAVTSMLISLIIVSAVVLVLGGVLLLYTGLSKSSDNTRQP